MRKVLSLVILVAVFLLQEVSAQSPGGVSKNMELWLNASNNVTYSGTNVSDWNDNSGNGFDFSTNHGSPQLNASGLNYNRTIDFDGDDDLELTSNLDIRTFFIVYKHVSVRDWETPFTNNNSDGLFHGDNNGDVYNNTYTSSIAKNGASYVNGEAVDLLSYDRPPFPEIHTRILSSNEDVNSTYFIGEDRTWASRGITGSIAEIISYSSELNNAKIKRIESYLGIKYSITLDNSSGGTNGDYRSSNKTKLWDASNNVVYHNDILGIGRDDDSGLDQRKSTSNILTLDKGGSFPIDNSFILTGNDGATNNTTTVGKHPNYSHRITKIWKTSVVGSPGTVSVSFTLGGDIVNSNNPSDYALLIDTDTDFSDGVAHTTGAIILGNTLTFTNVSLSTDNYISLATGNNNPIKAPGNVKNNIKLWLKADGNVTLSSSNNVYSWKDNSGNGYEFVKEDGIAELYTDGINFNKTLYFNGADDLELTTNLDLRTFFIVYNHLSTRDWETPFTNNNGHGIFHGDNNGDVYSNAYTPVKSKNGTSYVNGSSKNLLTHNRPSIPEIHTRTLTSNENTNSTYYIGEDRGITSRGVSGHIAEIVSYSSALSGVDRNKIESYLAIKYGITLDNTSGGVSGDYTTSSGSNIWDASVNSVFHHDIAGIGKDFDSELFQIRSKSVNTSSRLTISLGSLDFDNDRDFLVWGSNGASMSENSTSFLSMWGDCRMKTIGTHRKWKFKNTGSVGVVNLKFDMTGISNQGDFHLMIDEDGDGDYTTGNIVIVTTGYMSGSLLSFNTVSVIDGAEVILVRKTPSSEVVYNGSWSGGNGVGGELDNSSADLAKSVTISSDVTMSGSSNCGCLKIINNAKLSVNTGNSLTVVDKIDSDGAIHLYGTSQLVQKSTGVDKNIGSGVIYQIMGEATSSLYRYNYLSSSVHSTSVAYTIDGVLKFNTDLTDIEVNTNPSYTSSDDGVGTTISRRWLYSYASSGTWTQITENTSLGIGTGFTMKGTGVSNRYNFIGKPNNGQISKAIASGDFYLLGNPYPSSIDADALNSKLLSSNITTGTIYYWDQPSGESHTETQYEGGYATRANGVGVKAAYTGVTFTKVPGKYMKQGQGFFVEGGSSGGNIVFDNSLRVSSVSSTFFKVSNTPQKDIIRLGFEFDIDGQIYHRQLATVLDGGDMEKEAGKDAVMLDYFESDAYWMLPNEDSRFVITSVPVVNSELELPIGVVLESEKEITFKLDEVLNFSDNIYLIDKLKNTVTDLNVSTYSTSVSSGESEDRFVLLLNNNSLNTDLNTSKDNIKVIVNKSRATLEVKLEKGILNSLSIYNMVGQKVMESSENKVSTEKLSPQAYIVKVTTSLGSFSEKVIISN